MIKIKRFNEMLRSFDYDRIKRDLRSSHGWGEGSMTLCSEFEQNSEYFENPKNEIEYVDQFHVYLFDLFSKRMRGSGLPRQTGIHLGEWPFGAKISTPRNFYNKLS